ncbi:hypothetical protein BSKO_02978 [Bryopsis sp. KO-2023]|nr:hypothetical protein BSKO_02978 [Bryopsis sp. KO-2023]
MSSKAAEVGATPTEQAAEGDVQVSTIREGKAQIFLQGNQVFYNKAQVTNRDLSVAVLKYFVKQRQKEIDDGTLKAKRRLPSGKGAPPSNYIFNPEEITGAKIFEGLAASGLRSLRYSLEVPGVEAFVACDLDEVAVEAMKRNIAINGKEAEKLYPLHSDARLHMLQHPCFYEAIDLDPYGTPVQFLDSAVQSVSEGGLLLVTATDMAVLCGNHGEACHAKYGIYPLQKPYCHEMALRIVLACIEKHANRYKRHIVPMVSLSIDFYVRVFVRVYTSPLEVKSSASKLAYVYQSVGCSSYYLQRVGQKTEKKGRVRYNAGRGPVMEKCPETGSQFSIGGPIWAEPLHDERFLKGVLEDIEAEKESYKMFDKIKGMLTTASEELSDCPLFFDTHDVCKTVGISAIKLDMFASALSNAGYRASTTHCNSKAIKTDAPWEFVWDIVRAAAKKQCATRTFDPNTYAGKLMAKEVTHEIVFSNKSISKSRKDGLIRFPGNPEGCWGPRRRHGREVPEEASSGGKERVTKKSEGDGNGVGSEGAKAAKRGREVETVVEGENGGKEAKKVKSDEQR